MRRRPIGHKGILDISLLSTLEGNPMTPPHARNVNIGRTRSLSELSTLETGPAEAVGGRVYADGGYVDAGMRLPLVGEAVWPTRMVPLAARVRVPGRGGAVVTVNFQGVDEEPE